MNIIFHTLVTLPTRVTILELRFFINLSDPLAVLELHNIEPNAFHPTI